MAQVIGIRSEDKSVWEKRVPLVPVDVERLVADGHEILVQPSDIRVFDDEAYRRAGATLTEDLSPAGVVLAVKEVPLRLLMPDRAYVFFAHVIKGQAHNMPLLRKVLDLGITLVDYEKIADAQNRRMVKFGRQAGQAGMVETLWALGQRLAAEGVPTPLTEVRQPFHYGSLAAIRDAFEGIAARIEQGFAPPDDGPLVFAFTGRGSVSQGAFDVFELLPHERVTPEELPARLAAHHGDQTKLLFVALDKEHLAAPIDPSASFDETEYRAHPERYRARLPEYLPLFTALVHGVFWTEDYPRFVSRETIRRQWQRGGRRLRVIGDISCDIDGSIELTYKSTQPDAPTFVYDPESDRFTDGLEGPGIVVMAVDNLPCELSEDASRGFSTTLRDLVPALAAADWHAPFRDLALPPELKKAVIAHRGELTPDFVRLEKAMAKAGV